MDELRKSYTNIKYDITIIEIKENDKLDSISFFDIDSETFKDESKVNYKNKQNIYCIIQKDNAIFNRFN